MTSTSHVPVPHHRLITLSLTLATSIQTLDSTVTNVVLPRIQGSLSASQEQMAWVLTSYIVAAAVMIPLAGWLATRFGRKRVLLASICFFTVTSMLCGLAQTLSQLVLFRFLQGLAGAGLAPLSQATLLDINPPEKLPRAMSIWVTGVSVAPIVGPVLGGWLTEHLSWRWVFFINVPIGVLCFLGLLSFMPESATRRNRLDVFGLTTLSVAIIAFQLMLDRGQSQDWFNSVEIWIEATCAFLAAYLFAVHTATARDPFIHPRMFKDVSFTTGNCFIFMMGVLLFAPLALLPTLFQGLLNYPVLKAGLLMVPRGLGTIAAQLALRRVTQYVDPRLAIALGFGITSYALWNMSHFFLQMDEQPAIWSGVVQGIGTGLVFVPLTLTTFSTLPAQYRNEGSAFFGLMRNVGSSVGIAAVQAVFIRNAQVMHSRVAEHVTPFADGVPSLDTTAALATMHSRVAEQAAMMAYNNVFKLMFLLSVICVPFVLLLRKLRTTAGVPASAPVE